MVGPAIARGICGDLFVDKRDIYVMFENIPLAKFAESLFTLTRWNKFTQNSDGRHEKQTRTPD